MRIVLKRPFDHVNCRVKPLIPSSGAISVGCRGSVTRNEHDTQRTMTMTIKRQSTTAKITRLTLACIKQDIINGNGVVVRYKGQEHGIVDLLGGWLVDIDGTMIPYASCTIRKATLSCLPMIGETRLEHARA